MVVLPLVLSLVTLLLRRLGEEMTPTPERPLITSLTKQSCDIDFPKAVFLIPYVLRATTSRQRLQSTLVTFTRTLVSPPEACGGLTVTLKLGLNAKRHDIETGTSAKPPSVVRCI